MRERRQTARKQIRAEKWVHRREEKEKKEKKKKHG